MTQEMRKKMLEKVRKLLALAKSPNEHEAALATERAQAILAEYNLSESEVETTTRDEDDNFVVDRDMTLATNAYPWRRQLASAVAKLYFCTYFYQTVGTSGNRRDLHSFVGAKHNIEVAKLMFSYLNETIDRLAKEGALRVPPSERSPYRTTFRSACTLRLCHRIAERIEAAKRGEVKVEGGRNLPALLDLYDKTQKSLTSFIEKKVGPMRTRKTNLAILNTSGALDGRAAAERIGLDTQVGGRSKPSGLLR